ncbi:MAG: CheR family methyltransferase [Cyanobacteria bacterium P01_F01_bin.86]
MVDLDKRNDEINAIVGIGTSVAGIETLSQILRNLPTESDMGFVLVQPLDPDETSFLNESLDQITAMPVNTAADGMAVQAKQVYVMPPQTQMTIAQGRLQVAPCHPDQQTVKTIDLFFQSLATDQKNKAIAIILSGRNDDGALGIQAIRAAGGITFAQDGAAAELSGMPNAAIATGKVDFILSPVGIAEELAKIHRHPYLCTPLVEENSESPSTFSENDLLVVFRLLQKHTGTDFTDYKPTTFERRLRRRMALQKLPALADYVQYLQETPTEIHALYQDVLITVTSFFRDAEVYAALKDRVLPIILQQSSAVTSIRIWVPGCATGEEVYSIAMCLLENLDSLVISPTIQIFGTDLNDQAIEEARAGFYRKSRMEGVVPERQRRFFVEVPGGYQVNKSVRELCIFAQQDLGSDPPFSDLDLVSCRNVLIYFKPHLQKRVLSIFHYSLKSTGFLILGNSESVGNTSDLFEVFDEQTKFYNRRAVPTRLSFDFVTSNYPQQTGFERQQGFPASLNRSNVQQWADQIVLSRYGPVGVIVNEKLEILQFRGDTSSYLRPPLGEPSFNLLKMIRPSLLIDTRTAIEDAKQQSVTINRQGLNLEDTQGGDVALEVIPFTVSMSQERCFLLLFERLSSSRLALNEVRQPKLSDESEAPNPELEELRQELANTRQELLDTRTFLQLTIEEQESTHQQLIAANEEILSSNEELKSTNEELQTAKEEIQSSNEELKTTNEELQNRHTEAQHANDDLVNLIGNVNIPILMLSADLCIRNFTPAAQSIFNLIPTDIGRPISNLRLDIDIPNLETLISEVIETLNTLEREVRDGEGHWHLLRIRPYRTIENQIDGAVMALVDIDILKQTEADLRESQIQLESELASMSQVQRLSLQLFSSLDLDYALNEILDAAITIHNAERGCIQLYDRAYNVLEIVAHRGLGQACLDHLNRLSFDVNLSSYQLLRSGQHVTVEDIQSTPDVEPYHQMAAQCGFQAVELTPLINRNGELLGVISAYFHQPHRSSEPVLQVLDLYARQASEFIDLIRSESGRQQLLEREQAARVEAEAANASKDAFLSIISHELRTPLVSILGWAEMLQEEQMSEDELGLAIDSITDSANVQLGLIEDLLDTSRIVQVRFQIDRVASNLTDLLYQAVLRVHPQVVQKGIQLEVDLEDAPESVMLDPKRMTQVFSNLLSNALKFTPRNGHVTVRLTYSSSQMQIQMSDSGQGLNPDVLPYIFERFHQADMSDTRREGGLGLGLFLVRSIVEAHNGTIEAQSLGEGRGTTFTLTLPKIVATAEQVLPEPPPIVLTGSTLAGIRILLVEDVVIASQTYRMILQKLGAIVATAQSASEALAIITIQPLDILLSDIGLPDVNGYELIQQIRALPAAQGGQLPAIALTGYVSAEDIQAAIEAGFQQHLAKPISVKTLINAIYTLLRAEG